ncbi:hypothetical protein LPJ61_002182 [Coemansia biformis]|uniref:Uncharacterized protein n=1 Tax=Coemansia biformis TaxID=1286918 RepID=A0A9W7YF04_9FUNG|nr:hypothetical protein LPJ61_002182 [Coemansia biformis]
MAHACVPKGGLPLHHRARGQRRDADTRDAHCYARDTKHAGGQWRGLLAALNLPIRGCMAALLAICGVFYLLALQGGDLVYINDHLGIMGAEILVSVLALTALTAMLYACRMHSSTRRGAALAIACLVAGFYVYDSGERFEKHGFYNLLVFLAIYIPLNLVFVTLYVLWCRIDNFCTYLLIALAASGAFVGAALVYYRRVFDHGVRGSFGYVPGECTWAGSNIPLIDLLPSGAQNFWAGPMRCRREALDVRASIDTHGELHVQCDGWNADIVVDVLPETREWPLRDKDIWRNFNHLILERTVRLPYTPDAPFILNDTTQAVVVRCGASSTIASRVSPPVSRLPRYVPPSLTDTRTPARVKTSGHIIPDSIHARRDPPNVLYLMLDAVSRRQFHRRLPKSVRVLRTLHRPGTNRLTELYRFHSVGYSTDNNTKAMYLGEIYPTQPNTLPIWAYYRDRGFVTARIESGCEDWATEYNRRNYDQDDFSVGGRSLDYEFTAPFCLPEFYPNVGNPFGNFKGPYSIIARCLYGRNVHEWAFEYLYKLRRELRALRAEGRDGRKVRPYMITAAFLEGHEGTGEVLRTIDDALAEFLEDARDSGQLEDTVVIVGADHGLHMGINFAFLQNGRIEHQNPFFAMSVPEWLYQYSHEHQSALGVDAQPPLVTNEQRLTTPFDVHHTFRVLADWPDFDADDWRRSLFSPQKKGRTCDEAGIGSKFCMCQPS